jgi:serine phosphatase RsbU (regulator of sigma subunit)
VFTSNPAHRLTADPPHDSIELEIRQGTAKIGPGMVLVCFTDGLIERAKSNGRPFGARRLQQALVGAVVPPGVEGLTTLRDRLIRRVDEYVEHAPLEDDITLVLLGIGS